MTSITKALSCCWLLLSSLKHSLFTALKTASAPEDVDVREQHFQLSSNCCSVVVVSHCWARWINGWPSLCAIIPLCIAIRKKLKRRRMTIVPILLCCHCGFLWIRGNLHSSICAGASQGPLTLIRTMQHLLDNGWMWCWRSMWILTQSCIFLSSALLCAISLITHTYTHTLAFCSQVPCSLGLEYTLNFLRCV